MVLLYRYLSKNLTAGAEQPCWNMHFDGYFQGKLLFPALDMEKHELWSASYELQVTGWKLISTIWNSVQIHEVELVQIHEFNLVNPQVGSLNLRVTSS